NRAVTIGVSAGVRELTRRTCHALGVGECGSWRTGYVMQDSGRGARREYIVALIRRGQGAIARRCENNVAAPLGDRCRALLSAAACRDFNIACGCADG